VRQEWEYALSLSRPSFVRPVYWEQPMPERPDRGLPPESLRKLHFHRFPLSTPEGGANGREEAPRTMLPTRPKNETVNSIGMKLNVNSIGMKLNLIPAGDFLMGSPESDKDASNDEKPQHRVRIAQPFYLGTHQVTHGQFRRFIEATRYQTEAEKDGKGGWGLDVASGKWVQDPKFTRRSPGFDQTDDHPVVNVCWNDATAFSDWLSREEGQKYRLPTEAEWEYACRAGTTTRYSFGDNERSLGRYAWYAANSNGQTHPVGEKNPNAFGLYDMHGNVWEWCSDGYETDSYKQSPVADPRGPGQAAHRVVRGGSWGLGPKYVRSAFRLGESPGYRSISLGFRLARAWIPMEGQPANDRPIHIRT
jgi:formylglycine-generating enzyme required for sulfatase activity